MIEKLPRETKGGDGLWYRPPVDKIVAKVNEIIEHINATDVVVSQVPMRTPDLSDASSGQLKEESKQ